MDTRENKYKKILYVMIAIYVITSIIGFYLSIAHHDMRALGMSFVAVVTPFLIPLGFRILKLKPTVEIYMIDVAFVYFASLIGSVYNGYHLPYFDKVLHFLSGIGAALIALMIYWQIRGRKELKEKNDLGLCLLFVNNTNLAIAAL